jgi:hypothetical protein
VAAALNQNVEWPWATLPAVGSLAEVSARIVPWRQLPIGLINVPDRLTAPPARAQRVAQRRWMLSRSIKDNVKLLLFYQGINLSDLGTERWVEFVAFASRIY